MSKDDMKIAFIHNSYGIPDTLNELIVKNRKNYCSKQRYGYIEVNMQPPLPLAAEWGMITALQHVIGNEEFKEYDWFMSLRKEELITSFHGKVENIYSLKKMEDDVMIRGVIIHLIKDDTTRPLFDFLKIPNDVETTPLIITPATVYRNHETTQKILNSTFSLTKQFYNYMTYVDIAVSVIYVKFPELRHHFSFMAEAEWDGGILSENIIDKDKNLGFIGRDCTKKRVKGAVQHVDGGWLAASMCGSKPMAELLELYKKYEDLK